MKYCRHCGKEIMDEAVICISCGCMVEDCNPYQLKKATTDPAVLLDNLSNRVCINGIICLIIGVLQIFCSIFLNWVFLIIGVINIVTGIQNIKFSRDLLNKPEYIVAKFEPMTKAIIILIYNLLIGGIIGVVGSIYYFVAIRNYVMENKTAFSVYDKMYK